MRHVFPTSEVFHLWAHQTQSYARNPSGNVFFDGPTIYSYGRHFPVARIYERKGEKLVLLNSASRSVTTAKHQREAHQAVSHLRAMRCPFAPSEYNAKEKHTGNLAYVQKEIGEHLDKSQRAMQARNVQWRQESAESLHQDALDYSAFFGIRRKAPDFPADAFQAALDRATRIETPDLIRDAARIRANERKAALFNSKLAHYRDALLAHEQTGGKANAWRNGQISNVTGAPEWWADCPLPFRRALGNSRYGHWYGHTFAETLLRVSGDHIETSKGARIPLEHAPRIWRLVQVCRASARAYEKNGHTEHAGPYAIDSVNAQGDLKAGCHTILYGELELLARKLGFLNPLVMAAAETQALNDAGENNG